MNRYLAKLPIAAADITCRLGSGCRKSLACLGGFLVFAPSASWLGGRSEFDIIGSLVE